MKMNHQLRLQRLEIRLGEFFNNDDIVPFRNIYRDNHQGIEIISIDFRNTLSMSSAGIGMLLNLEREAVNCIQIQLINCSPIIKTLLEACHLGSKFIITGAREAELELA
jgi:anti-anti-sigma regulatory factor